MVSINLNGLNDFVLPLSHEGHMPRVLNLLALVLVVVGALNWGLVGLAQFDLVATLFGGQSAVVSRVVYALVGLAGVVLVITQAARAAPADRPAVAGVR
jgi:uncharacterized membrane protein YuzA (DUF378 family)